jgi:formylglycine-generating enzyme required for sulfatase activity
MLSIAKYLALVTTVVFYTSAQQAPRRMALVIGNSNYRSLQHVPAALADAELVRKRLETLKLRWDVDFVTDLDLQSLSARIGQFTQKIAPGDIVLFYYSGYAMQPDDDYLVPIDFDPKGTGLLTGRAQILRGVLDAFQSRRAGQQVVVLDAAWECPGLSAAGVAIPAYRMPDHTFVSVPTSGGVTLPCPSSQGATLFASSLVQAMNVAGAKLSGVFSQAAEAVFRDSNNQQLPANQAAVPEEFHFVEPKEPDKVVEYKEKPLQPGEVRPNQRGDQLNYTWIPDGEFQMGCVPGDSKCGKDESPHKVTISKGFWMSTTEVTVTAYRRFVKAVPGHPLPKLSKTTHGGVASETPINNIKWRDAQDYCRWAGGGLPTEAQWEYAARAGQPDRLYPFGNEINYELANYHLSIKPKNVPDIKKNFPETTPVGQYPKNAWNLSDMAGNVSEWVADIYDPAAYSGPGPFQDPEVKSGSKYRVIRGGSFNDAPESLRISARDHREPDKPENTIGFRCVMSDLK